MTIQCRPLGSHVMYLDGGAWLYGDVVGASVPLSTCPAADLVTMTSAEYLALTTASAGSGSPAPAPVSSMPSVAELSAVTGSVFVGVVSLYLVARSVGEIVGLVKRA